MELRRLDNVLVWQSRFGCPCPDPRDLTNAIGLGHRSRGYILKGSLVLPTMPMENYPETGGTGPRGRDRGGERPPGVAVWVAEGIIRVVLGVADSPCGCGV